MRYRGKTADKTQETNWKRNSAKILASILATLFLAFFPLQVWAKGKSFVLDFADSHIVSERHGRSSLYLKKALQEQYPSIDVSNYCLRKVVLVAKSKRGMSDVQLRVGPKQSGRYRISGNPRMFASSHHGSYSSVRIENPFFDSWGPWQLLLQGELKVRKVVLVVEQRKHRHGNALGRKLSGKMYRQQGW